MSKQSILAASASEVRRRDRIEDFGWNLLSGRQLDKLINFDQRDIIDDINRLYLQNPLASRIIKAKTNYVINEGFQFHAEDDDIQELLSNYWSSNRWDIMMETRANDLSVNGEMFILADVDEMTGKVTNRFPYPGLLEKKWKRDRYDDEIEGFKLANDDNEYFIIKRDQFDNYSGNAFYLYINKPTHLKYGLSDIFVSRDWLQMYDKSLFSTLERVGMILAFVWDVTINTKDVNIIKQRMQQLRLNPPRPGSVRVHNDTEIWKAESPNLNGGDISNIYTLLKGQCMTESGTPEFIFGLGGNVNYACYTEDTETLTINGWKHIDDIKENEKIATYNPEIGSIEYHIPLKRFEYNIIDDIYELKGSNVDIAVTNNHTMWGATSRNNPYKKIKVQDINQSRITFQDGIEIYSGEYQEDFILPPVNCMSGKNKKDNETEKIFKMDDWLEFLGIFISEGSIAVKDMIKRNSYHGTIGQLKEGHEKIGEILSKLNINHYYNTDNKGYTSYNFYGKQLIEWLYNNCGDYSNTRKIPRKFLNLSKDQLQILFDNLMWGDGTWNDTYGSYGTTSNQLADDFQELAYKLGYRTKKTIAYKSHMRKDGYFRNTMYRVSLSNRKNGYEISQDNIKQVRYDGKVYCFEVPNHLFITRRNGCITIQGNTSSTMLEPYFKDIKARQKYWKYAIDKQFDYAIWAAKQKNMIPNNIDASYTSGFPEPDQDKVKDYAQSLAQFANSIVILESNGVIEREDAVNVIRLIFKQIGVEMNDETRLQASSYYDNLAKKIKELNGRKKINKVS